MVNEEIINELTTLLNYYKQIGDKWRVRAYSGAISSIRSYNKEIKNREEAIKISGVGKAIADKIDEFLKTQKVQKVEKVKEDLKEFSEKVNTINIFKNIWGVGEVKASELYEKGFRSIEDIRKSGKKYLNNNQQIGLKYYEELLKPIPRDKITVFKYVLKFVLNREFGKNTYKLQICGSYRREKESSGDIDCLITSSKFNLEDIIIILEKYKIITEILSYKSEKFMGIAHCPNEDDNHFRFDIEFVDKKEWYTALLYFTGSQSHNITMRARAKKLGYKLDQHGLIKGNKYIEINSEKDVYDILGIDYVEPKYR
jgi:DNA polymerase/3'-5' exonuclease PolX